MLSNDSGRRSAPSTGMFFTASARCFARSSALKFWSASSMIVEETDGQKCSSGTILSIISNCDKSTFLEGSVMVLSPIVFTGPPWSYEFECTKIWIKNSIFNMYCQSVSESRCIVHTFPNPISFSGGGGGIRTLDTVLPV